MNEYTFILNFSIRRVVFASSIHSALTKIGKLVENLKLYLRAGQKGFVVELRSVSAHKHVYNIPSSFVTGRFVCECGRYERIERSSA